MQSRYAFAAVIAGCLSVATAALADTQTLTVEGRANIFGAGHLVPPAPGHPGSGILPPSFTFSAAPGQQIVFTRISGLVGCCATLNFGLANGPEGGQLGSGNTDVLSYGGIAGIADPDRTMFLCGVFTAGTEPVDPAPDRLDFSADGVGHGFRRLLPEINQVFFIGDGLTSNGYGAIQTFEVPSTATTLWLGFTDAEDFGAPRSLPGSYDDNVGQLVADFNLIDATILAVGDVPHTLGVQPTAGDPRRGGCRVRFSLPSAQPVSVRVFDVTGRGVRTLAAGQMLSAGANELAWDGRTGDGGLVRGGLYFARISCPIGAVTARILALP